MLWGCLVAGGSGALIKTGGIMKFDHYKNNSDQNLIASTRRIRLHEFKWSSEKCNG